VSVAQGPPCKEHRHTLLDTARLHAARSTRLSDRPTDEKTVDFLYRCNRGGPKVAQCTAFWGGGEGQPVVGRSGQAVAPAWSVSFWASIGARVNIAMSRLSERDEFDTCERCERGMACDCEVYP